MCLPIVPRKCISGALLLKERATISNRLAPYHQNVLFVALRGEDCREPPISCWVWLVRADYVEEHDGRRRSGMFNRSQVPSQLTGRSSAHFRRSFRPSEEQQTSCAYFARTIDCRTKSHPPYTYIQPTAPQIGEMPTPFVGAQSNLAGC